MCFYLFYTCIIVSLQRVVKSFHNWNFENKEIGGIFCPYFVLDFAEKGGKIWPKILGKGYFEKMKNEHGYHFLCQVGGRGITQVIDSDYLTIHHKLVIKTVKT